jgi:glycerophosphoryl diester phosphodiesterase
MHFPLPRWFAHRGGGSLAPENTLAGIRLAASLGYQAVEFDVMLSRDGTPVLIHDETLARTTNGTGFVCDTPDSKLFALNAGGGEQIPHFAQAAALCCEFGLLANIEIKPAAGYEIQTAKRVAELTGNLWHNSAIQPLISSFSLVALEIARDLAPQIPRGILFESVPPDWLDKMQRLQALTLHCNADLLTDAVLAEATARHIPVLCYTVNSKKQAKTLLERGVSAMFSDRLDLFASEAALFS